MAVDPNNLDITTIPNLPAGTLALADLLVKSNTAGIATKVTAQDLANFLAPYVASVGASGYVAVNSLTLPNPTGLTSAFTLVSTGTYTQTTGGNVVVTFPLAVLSWNGTTWTLTQNITIDLSSYVSNDDIKEYLNLDFSNLGGIVKVPEDRAATTFTASPLNPAVTYFESSLFFGGNIEARKIYIKAPVAGTVKVCFIEVIGANAQIVWEVDKAVTVGVNTFVLADFELPENVKSKPKLNIGISERNSPVGAATVKPTAGKNILTIPNVGLNAYSTISDYILNIWAEVDTAAYLIGGYKNIDYLSEYTPEDIYKTINPKDGINDFTGGVANVSYFGDGLQLLTPKQKLVRFNFKSTTADTFEIVFVNYALGNGSIIHTATKTVAANTLYSWTPADLSLPDLSSYERVYTFLHNTNPSTSAGTVKLSSSGVNEFFTMFITGDGSIVFDETSIYRVAYWMDVVNDNPNIEDQLKSLQEAADSQAVGTYDELIKALGSQNIITLKDGTIEATATINVPAGKTIKGSKNAILKAGFGVDVVIKLTGLNVCLEGFTIIGNGANVDINSTSKINNPIDIEQNPTNLGTGIGVLCEKASGDIKNLRITNFDRSGIELGQTLLETGDFPIGINITGVVCENNYFGIRTIYLGEYSRFSDVHCLRNVCGISVVSGNIAVSNSHFTQNRIGAHVGGKYGSIPAADTNNAHGGFANCFFNHNSLRGLYVVNITNAQVFSNCNFFDGIIDFVNSIGVCVTGSLIASEIKCTSNTSQLSMITNCVFRSDGGSSAGTITKTGSGRLSMFGNRYSTGKSDALLNQEL